MSATLLTSAATRTEAPPVTCPTKSTEKGHRSRPRSWATSCASPSTPPSAQRPACTGHLEGVGLTASRRRVEVDGRRRRRRAGSLPEEGGEARTHLRDAPPSARPSDSQPRSSPPPPTSYASSPSPPGPWPPPVPGDLTQQGFTTAGQESRFGSDGRDAGSPPERAPPGGLRQIVWACENAVTGGRETCAGRFARQSTRACTDGRCRRAQRVETRQTPLRRHPLQRHRARERDVRGRTSTHRAGAQAGGGAQEAWASRE